MEQGNPRASVRPKLPAPPEAEASLTEEFWQARRGRMNGNLSAWRLCGKFPFSPFPPAILMECPSTLPSGGVAAAQRHGNSARLRKADCPVACRSIARKCVRR